MSRAHQRSAMAAAAALADVLQPHDGDLVAGASLTHAAPADEPAGEPSLPAAAAAAALPTVSAALDTAAALPTVSAVLDTAVAEPVVPSTPVAAVTSNSDPWAWSDGWADLVAYFEVRAPPTPPLP